ncbi:maestro heat-like repeat-containing protein family member 2A isoform X2 [Podarcis muralis]
MLQQDEASAWQKVAIYRSLQAMMEHGLEVEPAGQFILAASKHLRASPDEVPRELQAAASSTLATFACHHFHPIMMELQHQLKPFAPPDEFTLLTLGKIAANNVYSCVPFLGITLTTLQTAMRRIEDGRRRRALCTALEQMCGAIRIYLRTWERSSYPRISVQQFSAYLLPLYSCMTRTWLPGCDAQVQLAVLKTLSPILRLLLPRTDFQAQIYNDISLLLAQYDSSTETFLVTKILGQILEASLVNNNPIPREHVGPLTCALVRQICIRGQKWPPHPQCEENFKEIAHIFLRLARLHPSGLMGVFQGKVEERQEDVCAVLLALFSEIVGAQLPELWSRRQLCVRVVKAALGDDSTRVRRRRDWGLPAAGPGTQSSRLLLSRVPWVGQGPQTLLSASWYTSAPLGWHGTLSFLARSGSQVRLATLRAIGRLLRTSYLERIEGWPLNYVSLQMAVSAHQLVRAPRGPALPLSGLETSGQWGWGGLGAISGACSSFRRTPH